MESITEITEWLRQEPDEQHIATLSGGKFIPINIVEELLDNFYWSTQNFKWQIFKDGYSNNCVAASIEVVVEFGMVKRTFTGACNFSIKALYPNQHFLATAKSECVKNAVSDIGKRFGRGLNEDAVPNKENVPEATGGINLDDGIEQYKMRANAT